MMPGIVRRIARGADPIVERLLNCLADGVPPAQHRELACAIGERATGERAVSRIPGLDDAYSGDVPALLAGGADAWLAGGKPAPGIAGALATVRQLSLHDPRFVELAHTLLERTLRHVELRRAEALPFPGRDRAETTAERLQVARVMTQASVEQRDLRLLNAALKLLDAQFRPVRRLSRSRGRITGAVASALAAYAACVAEQDDAFRVLVTDCA